MRQVRSLLDQLRDRFGRLVRDPGVALPSLLLAAFVVRAAWLDRPPGGLIFDEAYYVNAVRILLGLPVAEAAPYAGAVTGLDPNIEHPPLGKLLIAASMFISGDDAVGWRLPSLIAGMIVLVATYQIVRSLGETAALALVVVGIVAFDNLAMVHSRIATLDILVLAPILLGAWLAIRGRWAVAGLLMGIGFLIKLTASYGLLALVVVLALQGLGRWRHERRRPSEEIRAAGALLATFGIVAVGGLWLLDAQFTTFTNPLDHVRHMVEYGASLKEPVDRTGFCAGAASAPWQWPFNECEINYLRVDSITREGDIVVARVSAIDFRGALNPLLAAAIPLAALTATWVAWRTHNRLAIWAVIWGVANWLPYVLLVIVGHRVTYMYYFLPVVPAAAAAVAILLLRSGLPRVVSRAYALAYILGFVAYFPFRQVP